MNELPTEVISVSQFVDILNETLSFAFPAVTVEGEVHSYKVNQGKWVFFDLKDDKAGLGCFLPLGQLKVPLEDGMNVRVTGVPKLTAWGKFSFTVRQIELAGEGELRRAFELLRSRLGDEGLFDISRKRPLPRFPKTIGLVTSAGSAAYSDFMKILNARWGGVTIKLADVQVQGAPAPAQIVGALNYFNQLAGPVEVVVLIRGGGSLEDLQAFNTEAVARAVAASRSPIIVGVGHEVDTSLADLAADVRAATPTEAAQLVVPDGAQLARDLNAARHSLERGMITNVLGTRGQVVSQLAQVVFRSQEQLLHQTSQDIVGLERVLGGYNPQANLKRGYAIARSGGKIVRSAAEVSAGNELMVQLGQGQLTTQVTKTTDHGK